jgi:putrescine transport system substrate-binding protein
MAIRPYVKEFHSSKYIDALAGGEICVVLGYSGDIIQAGNRAKEVKNGVDIHYLLPKEGAQMWFDTMGILADAPNKESAYQLINYLLRQDVMAHNSNKIGYANAHKTAIKMINKDLINNKNIYPDPEVLAKMYTVLPADSRYDRLRNRSWTRVLHGR